MDVDLFALFAEAVAEGEEQSEQMSFVEVFDVFELCWMGGLLCYGVVAKHQLV